MTSQVFLYTMSLLCLVAGVNHFVNPGWYLKIIPSRLSAHFPSLKLFKRACEIVFTLLLLPSRVQEMLEHN